MSLSGAGHLTGFDRVWRKKVLKFEPGRIILRAPASKGSADNWPKSPVLTGFRARRRDRETKNAPKDCSRQNDSGQNDGGWDWCRLPPKRGCGFPPKPLALNAHQIKMRRRRTPEDTLPAEVMRFLISSIHGVCAPPPWQQACFQAVRSDRRPGGTAPPRIAARTHGCDADWELWVRAANRGQSTSLWFRAARKICKNHFELKT